jgi:hypothetical protein
MSIIQGLFHARWERRRKEVEQDGVFYCRGCGTKTAKKPSGHEAPLCSPSCKERFQAASSLQLIAGMPLVVSMGADAEVNAARSRKWKTYCAWCGATLTEFGADTCPKCYGNPWGIPKEPQQRSTFLGRERRTPNKSDAGDDLQPHDPQHSANAVPPI